MSNESQSLLKEIKKPGILRLILNEPKNKNALSKKMISDLKEAISLALSDDSVKVIIIAANGNVYSAGHDLKEITDARTHKDGGNSYFKDLFNSCSDLMKLIVECPKPIIAEVNGVATAAGCQLIASCDLAISSNNSVKLNVSSFSWKEDFVNCKYSLSIFSISSISFENLSIRFLSFINAN